MKINKKISVYLNYLTAHIIDFANISLEIKTFSSGFTHEEKMQTLSKAEITMHHKEQTVNAAYFKTLLNELKNYNEILLFGPTKAKDELHNILKAEHHFNDVDIVVLKTDDMSEHEQERFVMNYFSRKINLQSI
jgi:ribonucleotide monophosphatase NagD (HAD superfamily)